ncbi:hypothetical protein [Streptomyces sp. NBC_00158]|uniref:hypothetical protein n=1 Tax=Streptomyces sp. NBC_00158 TaxID=2903627 RepID=UPI00324506C5
MWSHWLKSRPLDPEMTPLSDPVVRALMAKPQVWELLSDPVRERLRADTDPRVREAVAALDARPEPEPEPET